MVHAGEYSEPLSYTARSDGNFRFADHPHNAAAHAIPPSRRSDANLNFRLSRWTDALRLFVVVYCVSHFVSIILRNEAALFVTTP